MPRGGNRLVEVVLAALLGVLLTAGSPVLYRGVGLDPNECSGDECRAGG